MMILFYLSVSYFDIIEVVLGQVLLLRSGLGWFSGYLQMKMENQHLQVVANNQCLILFFWIRILTVVVRKGKNWNHWRINLYGIEKACLFSTYLNPNFLHKIMQDSSHCLLINLEGKPRQVQSNPLHIQYLMWIIWFPKHHLWQVFYRNCLVGLSPKIR